MRWWALADTGDTPWDAELPQEALTEIEAAKGTIFEMGATAWWCGPPVHANGFISKKPGKRLDKEDGQEEERTNTVGRLAAPAISAQCQP